MPNPNYYRKYKSSDAWRPGSGEFAFLEFLESLNEADWTALLEDIILNNPQARKVLLPAPGEEPLTQAAATIGRLGSVTHRLIASAIERLVGAEDENVAVGALFVAGVLPLSFTKHFLMDIAVDPNTKDAVRVEAARGLANNADDVPLRYWESLDIVRSPSLIPALISALSERDPARALQRLRELSSPPPSTMTLEYPLRMTLRSVSGNGLTSSDGYACLLQICGKGPPWLRHAVEEVLSFPEFHNFLARIEADLQKVEKTTSETTLAVVNSSSLAKVFSSPPARNFFPEKAPDFVDLLAQSVSQMVLVSLKKGDSDVGFKSLLSDSFRALNGHSRSQYGERLATRMVDIGLTRDEFSSIWPSILQAEKTDHRAVREVFAAHVLKQYTCSWIRRQGWALKHSEIMSRIFEVLDVKAVTRHLKGILTETKTRSFALAVSKFHEDQILASLVRNALREMDYHRVELYSRPWGSLETAEHGQADFGLVNDGTMSPAEKSKWPPIYKFKGYYLFARRDWLVAVRKKETEDGVKQTIDELLEGSGPLSSSANGKSIQYRAWLAFHGNVKIGFRELCEPLIRARAQVTSMDEAEIQKKVKQHEDQDVQFDDELEDFLRGGEVNIFLGGAIHARLLKRWWTTHDGVVQLLGPADFQHLIGDGWPPYNRLLCAHPKDQACKKLTTDLAKLYRSLGKVLRLSAESSTDHEPYDAILHHCLTIITGGEKPAKGSKWNFVTHVEDLRLLLREDDEFAREGASSQLS